MFNIKKVSKMMVALLATAVVTSFSIGTADACYGGADGTKGCTSGVSYGTSYPDEMTIDGYTFEGEGEVVITTTSKNEGVTEGTDEAYSEGEEIIEEVGENTASGSGEETVPVVYTGSNDGFLGSYDDFVEQSNI